MDEIGAGLKQLPDERIVCTNAGVLRYRPANRYWVEFNHKRVRETASLLAKSSCIYCCGVMKQYVASMDDGVIGIVTDRNAEFYRVNIGAAYVELSSIWWWKSVANCLLLVGYAVPAPPWAHWLLMVRRSATGPVSASDLSCMRA